MDLDDIEYLEKGVEDPENSKAENQSSGGGVRKREGDNKSYRSSRRRAEDDENGGAEDDDEERVTYSKRSSKWSRGERENGSEKRGAIDDRDRERERERERSSRSERRSGGDKDRHRSSTDLEKDTERDRGDKGRGDRGREKDRRGRDREREREKGSSRDKEKEKEREKEREKEKEKEREKERSRRSSSHSARHRSDTEKEVEKEVVRGKSRDREIREAREKEREHRDNETREREKEMSRRFKDKKENMEPEADPERDQRTVFAYQMPLKATERDVYEFFSKAGKVRDVRLIMDRNSRRSKGVGYIEFYDAMSVPMAIALSGHQLFGQPVMVKPSEAEKNLVQSTATPGGSTALAGPYGAVARKLYIGNLHFNMTEDQLRQVFEPFGPVELVQLPLDLETGQCKGFGFVQFAQLEHAKAAQSLNGKLEIAGRVIKVSAVTDHVGVQNAGANASDFDDDDGGGLTLNAQSRAMLMQKLDHTGVATSIVGSLGVPMVNGQAPAQQFLGLPVNLQAGIAPALAVPAPSEPIGNPSDCLLLKNMFDPASETEPDFDLDIRDEVQEECSQFGPVKHCYVDKHSAGHVYLRFETVAASASCQRAMHARWFARRLIAAIFMQPHEYEAKFSGGGG